jgi:hypothetical protein
VNKMRSNKRLSKNKDERKNKSENKIVNKFNKNGFKSDWASVAA